MYFLKKMITTVRSFVHAVQNSRIVSLFNRAILSTALIAVGGGSSQENEEFAMGNARLTTNNVAGHVGFFMAFDVLFDLGSYCVWLLKTTLGAKKDQEKSEKNSKRIEHIEQKEDMEQSEQRQQKCQEFTSTLRETIYLAADWGFSMMTLLLLHHQLKRMLNLLQLETSIEKMALDGFEAATFKLRSNLDLLITYVASSVLVGERLVTFMRDRIKPNSRLYTPLSIARTFLQFLIIDYIYHRQLLTFDLKNIILCSDPYRPIFNNDSVLVSMARLLGYMMNYEKIGEGLRIQNLDGIKAPPPIVLSSIQSKNILSVMRA